MKKILLGLSTLCFSAFVLSCTPNSSSTTNNTPPPTGALFTNGNGVTDIDGNQYPSIIINGQEWMQKNLNVSKYRNGDVIPHVVDNTTWRNLTTGAWCYYEHTTANGTIYGKLYNWYAVNDPRGLAPQGWHVSSNDDWTIINTFLGGTTHAASKMKEVGNTHWTSKNTDATNESGFTALPGGQCWNIGGFVLMGTYGEWWTSNQTTNSTTYADNYSMLWNGGILFKESTAKNFGFSVRCVKN